MSNMTFKKNAHLDKHKYVNKRKYITKKINKHPARGWSKLSPSTKQRVIMFKKCGKKCFLGPKRSFPICIKNTCKVSKRGVYAAYMRARQWGKAKHTYKSSKPTHPRKTYKKIANKAKRILNKTNQIKQSK